VRLRRDGDIIKLTENSVWEVVEIEHEREKLKNLCC
jgi:hypothetical protein